MAQTTYTITHCIVADGPELSRNNLPAFWQDPTWVLSWRHTTLENHIETIAKRIPRNLINDRTVNRHQKALDPATGRIVGYIRWILPESSATLADGTPAWPEAVVPAVSAEEEAEIRRVAAGVNFNPSHESDALDVEVGRVKEELLAKKEYMRA